VLGLATWPIHFSGGDLVLAFTDNATLGADNKFTNPSPYPMSLNVALPSGLIKGSVTTPSPPRNVPFKGILLQNQNSGYGYFLGTDQSGRVSFTP
jgi:hypothetical protein